MPTNYDETLSGRIAREHAADLARYAKMTPEQIEALFLELHNARCATDAADRALAIERHGSALLRNHCKTQWASGHAMGKMANAEAVSRLTELLRFEREAHAATNVTLTEYLQNAEDAICEMSEMIAGYATDVTSLKAKIAEFQKSTGKD